MFITILVSQFDPMHYSLCHCSKILSSVVICFIIASTNHFCFSETNSPPHENATTITADSVGGSQVHDLKHIPFTLIRQKSEKFKNTEDTCISVLGKYTLPLGIWQADDSFAIHLDSITVRELSGSQDLWLIEWWLIDNRRGTNKFFFVICQAENPETILLKGNFYPLGAWTLPTGMGLGSEEENLYRIDLSDRVLTLWTERRRISRRTEPMPLHTQDEWGIYTAEVNTRVTRTFRIERDELVPMQTVLEYQVQKNDTLDEIYQSLEIESAWLTSPRKIPPAGQWISFSIPSNLIDSEENDGSWVWRWWGGRIWMKFVSVEKK